MASFLGQSTLPRGIRNNNPGNLILTSIKWQGKIENSKNTDGKFEQFTSVEYGIRAMLKDIINDVKKGKNTITKLISEYAPPSENNTANYINFLANSLGISPNQVLSNLNSTFLKQIARTIIKIENGTNHVLIKDSSIDKAIQMTLTNESNNNDASSVSENANKICPNCGKIIAFVLPIVLFFYTIVTVTI